MSFVIDNTWFKLKTLITFNINYTNNDNKANVITCAKFHIDWLRVYVAIAGIGSQKNGMFA
jgi:hypothetical protein